MSYMKAYLMDLYEKHPYLEAQMAVQSAAFPGKAPPPLGHPPDPMETYIVKLSALGQIVECEVQYPRSRAGTLSKAELEREAHRIYFKAIDAWAHGHIMGLPKGCKHLLPGVKSMSQIAKEHDKAMQESFTLASYDVEAVFPQWTDGLPDPKTESEKPEGTRDVDKYLKEQQDKLWRGR